MKGKIQPLGFTLMELMIVMAIVALLMSLVGPMTILGYEKIQAKEEKLSLQNWIKGNSYRSFATSKAGTITLNKNTITFRFQVNDLALPQTIPVNSTHEGSPSEFDPSNLIISQRAFKYLTFPEQNITVNTFGLIQPTSISIQVNNKEQVVDLSKKINGSSK